MNYYSESTYTAFIGTKHLTQGPLAKVAVKVKNTLRENKTASILVFNDTTGKTTDLNLHGSVEDVISRYQHTPSIDAGGDKKAGPGRPKLGVVSREISLLPRHWDWLSTQPGGASVTLRKLVEEAKKKNLGQDQLRIAREVTYKFMSVMAGDLPGYEEALRALYANNSKVFRQLVTLWPKDIAQYASTLAHQAFL